MKQIIITALTLMFSIFLRAQIISNYSIDSGGNSVNVGNISFIYTIGEINVRELNSGNIYISEGFINTSIVEALNTKSYTINPIDIYPNPTSKYLNIATKDEFSKIDIFDLNGRKILVANFNKQIDISHLSSGIYLIKFYSEKRQLTKRIIKH